MVFTRIGGVEKRWTDEELIVGIIGIAARIANNPDILTAERHFILNQPLFRREPFSFDSGDFLTLNYEVAHFLGVPELTKDELTLLEETYGSKITLRQILLFVVAHLDEITEEV